MAVITNKDSIHYVVVPSATSSDVVTAVGVNKLMAGGNTAAINGVEFVSMHSRIMPSRFASPPTQVPIETPFICHGNINLGGGFVGPLFDWQGRGELADGLDRLTCSVDLKFANNGGVCKLYIRSDFGAIWEFAEIYADILTYTFILGPPGPDAIEIGVNKRVRVLIDVALDGSILPPAGRSEERYLEVTFKEQIQPSNPTLLPSGVFNINTGFYKA